MQRVAGDGQGVARTEWGKLTLIGLMYMAQTFPSGFVSSFIPSIFRQQGLDLSHFWVFSLPLIPYWLRWAIAPAVDTYWLRSLGRRRSWMIPCTIVAVAAYASLALVQPTLGMLNVILAILLVKSIFTATQEVAIDAYVVDNVRADERPKAAALNTAFEAGGQMIALVALGIIVEKFGWRIAAVTAALLMFLFLLPTFLRREPPVPDDIASALKARRPGLAGAFAPLARFLTRRDTWLLIPVLLMGGLYTGALFPMLGPFLVDQGFGLSQVGLIVGVTLALATVAGATLAASLAGRVGSRRLLGALALLAIPAAAPAAWMATTGATFSPAWTIAILMLPTLVTATFYVLFVSLRLSFASTLQSGTDYATGAAVSRIGQTAAGALGGPLAAWIGWNGYFWTLGGLGAAAALVLLLAHNPLQTMVRSRNERELATPSASVG